MIDGDLLMSRFNNKLDMFVSRSCNYQAFIVDAPITLYDPFSVIYGFVPPDSCFHMSQNRDDGHFGDPHCTKFDQGGPGT